MQGHKLILIFCIQSISGNTWYQQQALRAVNQAIGRVIRHRKDYGAILLCDERFANQRTVSQLSAWIRDHVTVYDSYGELHSNLIRFFKGMEQNNVSLIEKLSDQKIPTYV